MTQLQPSRLSAAGPSGSNDDDPTGLRPKSKPKSKAMPKQQAVPEKKAMPKQRLSEPSSELPAELHATTPSELHAAEPSELHATEPAVHATEPAVHATEPAVRATEPATEPAVHATEPAVHATEPSEELHATSELRATEPSELHAAEPSASSRPTEPSGSARPSEPAEPPELSASEWLRPAKRAREQQGEGGAEWVHQGQDSAAPDEDTARGANLFLGSLVQQFVSEAGLCVEVFRPVAAAKGG